MSWFRSGPGHEKLDPEAFARLANHLDQLSQEGLARAVLRKAKAQGALVGGRATPRWWEGGHAVTFADGIQLLDEQVASVEPSCGNTYFALRELAAHARQLAEILRDTERYEKSWNEQLVSNVSEWQDRTLTAAAAGLPGTGIEADAQSALITELWQQRTREAEAASIRRADALRNWDAACQELAGQLADARAKLDAALASPIEQLAQPESGYNADAARGVVQRNWLRLVERVVEDRAGDEARLREWWESLDGEERKAIIKGRGDLVSEYLSEYLTSIERRLFTQSNIFPAKEEGFLVEGEGVLLYPPFTIRLTANVSAGKKVSSDGTTELSIALSADAAVGVGLPGSLTLDAGRRDKSIVSYTFASEAEADAALAELKAALLADAGNPLYTRTLGVLADRFDLDQVAIEEAEGAGSKLAAGLGLAEAEAQVVGGTFTNSQTGEAGLFIEAAFKTFADATPKGQATVEATLDGRLVLTPEGRRYLRYTTRAEASASGPLLESLGLTGDQIAGIPLPASGSGMVTASGEIEVTDENLPTVAVFLSNLASKRIDPANATKMHEGSNIIVTTATGSHVIARTPDFRGFSGEAGTQSAETAGAYHKPVEGDYYDVKENQ